MIQDGKQPQLQSRAREQGRYAAGPDEELRTCIAGKMSVGSWIQIVLYDVSEIRESSYIKREENSQSFLKHLGIIKMLILDIYYLAS